MAKHFKSPEWAFFTHVNEGTGRNLGRIVDALAMSLYPSRGLHLHGFEVKVSRGDWLRELADPSKADGWFQACHGWWLATPPDIIRREDLPHGWGHLVVKPTGECRAAVTAPIRDVPPLNWERMAGFLRVVGKKLHDSVPRRQLQKLADAEAIERERAAAQRARVNAASLVREEKRAVAQVLAAARAFEAASGISLTLHNTEQARRAGAALRAESAASQALRGTESALLSLRNALGYAERAVQEMRKGPDDAGGSEE